MATLIRNVIGAATRTGTPSAPSLQALGVLFDTSGFPGLVADVARYYSRMRLTSGQLAAKKSWAELGSLFSADTQEIVIYVSGVGTPNPVFDIKTFNAAEKARAASMTDSPTTRVFVLEKIVIDTFQPQTDAGVVFLMGKNTAGEYGLILLRQSLSIPTGGGGPPYAGARLPN